MKKNNMNNIKDYVKYILKKSYRNDIRRRIKESSIEAVSCNKCNEDTAMILRRLNTKVGVFSDYIVFLKAIEFSIEKGYVPVIDRQTVTNDFLPANGNVNTWELFFEQPLSIGLNDIDPEKMNVMICNTGGGYPVSLLRCNEDDTITYWRKIASKYIRFNKEMEQYLLAQKERILGDKRVLGVSFREGYNKLMEMKSRILWGHPIQKSFTNIIDDIKNYLELWNCEAVFFTCQTTETEKKMKNVFGNKAICYERKRVEYDKLVEGNKVRGNKNYEQAVQNEKDYITEIYLLSNCTSMICSENSGSEGAFILSKGFENFICYDEGTYK